jgi:hypothetical protein
MSFTAVYRVRFVGGELGEDAGAALAAAGAAWEGSESGAEGPWRHRALVEASGEQQAIARVRDALVSHGAFHEYQASAVTDARGRVHRGPFYRSWCDIDWAAVPRRARLTDLQRRVLRSLMDDVEPTWIVAADPDVAAGRAEVEAVLSELEAQNLVASRLEEGGEPGRESELDRWWAVTDEGWDLLGMIRSPRYHW